MLICLSACKQQEPTEQVDNNACGLDSCDYSETSDYLIAQNQITLDEILTKIDNSDSFVLYLYFNECPWCKELGPIVSDYLKDKEELLNMTYAFNVRPNGDRDKDYRYKDSDGNFNYPDFEKLYDYMYDYLDDDKTVYAPTLIFIKDGEIVNFHVGTVEGHDATKRQMNDEEIKALEETIKEYYSIYD